MLKNTQIIIKMWPNDSYITFYPEHYSLRWKMLTGPPFCHLLSSFLNKNDNEKISLIYVKCI